MSDMSSSNSEIIRASLKKRYAAEKRFQWYGRLAVLSGFVFLAILLGDIVNKAMPAFTQSYLKVDVHYDPEVIGVPSGATAADLYQGDYYGLIRESLRSMFPDVSGRSAKRDLYGLVSNGAEYQLRDYLVDRPEALGSTISVWVMAHSEADAYLKGQVDTALPESDRRIKDRQIAWLDQLGAQGRAETRFNVTFFTAGDSRDPELAGIRAALLGSFFTLLVTFLLSFPLGVMAAIYLEEFAPRNRITDLIEININNLAAVPSIVFGLLGATGRRPGADADDPADHHHHQPRRDPVGLAIDPRGGPRRRRVAPAGRVPSCPAGGDAGHSHRLDHRHGSGAGRDGAAADDRHGGLHHGRTRRRHRSGHGAAGTDLSLGRQPGAWLHGEDLGGDPGPAGIPDGDECAGDLPAQAFRNEITP